MSKNTAPVLLVEDTQTLALLYEEFLRREGYSVFLADDGKKAFQFLDETQPLAIVLDLLLPDSHGLEILSYARNKYPDMPVIVVTITNSIDVAVEAMRRGAYDYIVKPLNSSRLAYTLRNALDHKKLVHEVDELRRLTGMEQFHGFVGQADVMQAVYRVIDSVAPSKAPVFLVGESGTGKELAAHAIHNASPRRSRPFVPINCSAIPQELIESIIFGHVKGAFTGAISDQPGAAKSANGGTLFLDEICEMPLEIQTKLLRFIQTGEAMPVGSNKIDYVDVRIIAATNRDPAKEMREKRFREDLFYRLHVVPVEMPPLRERGEDVLILASHFLTKFSAEEGKNFTTLSPEVMTYFRRYEWPGNVRQLENVIRNVVVLHKGPVVEVSMLPKDFLQFVGESAANIVRPSTSDDLSLVPDQFGGQIKPLWQSEKEAIIKALEITNNDITKAATMLEVSPSTLYRKLNMWRHEEARDDNDIIY